jgi:lysophospholipase L1-like esterase
MTGMNNAVALKHADGPAYNDIIARVAHNLDVILVDRRTHWQEAKPTRPALQELLADPLHPNGAGHHQFAIEFFRMIGCYHPTAPECRP